ncbi:MAG TPA: ABC transporter permease [Acidimicrobiales bacterium]|nr:ABC transporter permease [Acidimicrobiales bacterium]
MADVVAGGPPVSAGGFGIEARSQWRLVLRRFLRHRAAVVSLVVLVLLIVLSLVGGRVWKYDYAQITDEFSTGPSLEHPMGTDGVGHDTFARVLRGAQKSVQVMLLVALFSTAIGVVVGAVAGFYRGAVDAVLMRFIDLVLTIPTLAILAVLSNKVRQSGSWFGIAIVIAALAWTSLARIVRAEILSLREKEFVEAARAAGATDARIIFRHLLPNVVGSVIVAATLTMAAAILIETTLSYLGLGIDAPDTSLGLLVSEGQAAAKTRPWLFYFPGLFIIVIVLCVNFIGDGLRDAFDPKQTRVRA